MKFRNNISQTVILAVALVIIGCTAGKWFEWGLQNLGVVPWTNFELPPVNAIRCYQCSSQSDRKGVDSCGAYKWFNKTQHIAIECNSDESHMPGSFCMKVVQQGPKGFICELMLMLAVDHFHWISFCFRGWTLATGDQEMRVCSWHRRDWSL